MSLGEGYDEGLSGGVNKETEERFTKAVVLDNWEEDGIINKERFPECYSPDKTICQAQALTSDHVLKCARLITATRHLAISSRVTRPMSP